MSQNFLNPQSSRTKPFHVKYRELCKARNSQPLPEISRSDKNSSTLSFFGDRIRLDDWLSIFSALFQDTSLHCLAIKLRKNAFHVFENLNSMKRVRKSQSNHPAILSQFLFNQLTDSISNFAKNNPNLTTLVLEGLPLTPTYLTSICESISKASSLKNLSLSRSSIGDSGCAMVCSVVKHLPNIDCLNLASCLLTSDGAREIAELIKYQKIMRYSEGWERTLRYQSVNPDTIPGLKRLTLNSNAFGDEGVEAIMEVLKEDCWIRVVELRNTQMSDDGAKKVLECLEVNKHLLLVDVDGNKDVSAHSLNKIRTHFAFDSSEDPLTCSEETEPKPEDKVQKMRQKMKLLETQFKAAQFQKQQVEKLNETLYNQCLDLQKKVTTQEAYRIPEGYTLVLKSSFDSILSEREELKAQLEEKQKPLELPTKQRKRQLPRTCSEMLPNRLNQELHQASQSASCLPNAQEAIAPYFETNIGDTVSNSSDILKVFMKRKTTPVFTDF